MMRIHNTVELGNGVRLPYIEQGDPAGVPILSLHGVTDSMHSFDTVLPYLPRSVHAYALTQRGHGDADRFCCGERDPLAPRSDWEMALQ